MGICRPLYSLHGLRDITAPGDSSIRNGDFVGQGCPSLGSFTASLLDSWVIKRARKAEGQRLEHP